MKLWPLLLAAGAGGAAMFAGCGIPLTGSVVEIANRCNTDADCGGGRCIEKTCVATSADLGELIIEVEVPAGAEFAPNTTHVLRPSEDGLVLAGDSGGFYQFHDLLLPDVVPLTVSLGVDNIPATCGGLVDDDGSIPIRVELRPTRASFGEIPPGIATAIYTVTTQPESETNAVTISVPAGAYDVYIVPVIPEVPDEMNPFEDCHLPPRLLRDRNIADGVIAENVTFDETSITQGSVEGFDFEGWTVTLVENKRGRLMSDVFTLTVSDGSSPSQFDLLYWQENEPEDLDVVLQLAPPEELTRTQGMPVFYWKLSGLPNAAARIDQLSEVEPIEVEGSVVDTSFAEVPSILTIQSNSISLDFGDNVIFRRAVETNGDGTFNFPLLPGNYTIIIEPLSGDELAVTRAELEINPGDQGGGKTLTVANRRSLSGRAFTAQGDAASRITATLEPAAPASQTFLQAVKQNFVVPPRSASTLTDDDGLFALLSDSGTFNLSLRPTATSDLPWTVVPNYLINEGLDALDDVQLEVPNPVIVVGQVRGDQRSVANVRIRAWLRPSAPTDDSDPTPNAIQIAEATSRDDGTYRLLLPGSLATISR